MQMTYLSCYKHKKAAPIITEAAMRKKLYEKFGAQFIENLLNMKLIFSHLFQVL
jgi:hypothetical protein